tara:strand:+ start:547 stop:1188 length:642 start_codon:yes stop_codon:yes gene_type:complete
MLYIFSHFPESGLNAGGLQYAIEDVEELGLIEHDPAIQVRKSGVYVKTPAGEERLRDTEYLLSPSLLLDGITWELWFPANFSFGNGIVIHKSHAGPEYRTMIAGTNITVADYRKQNRGNTYRESDVQLVDEHWRHNGWNEYEARWLPGTCPQENHIVHLTWLVTTHKLPAWAYERIRTIVEEGAEPLHPEQYEKHKHFSEIRQCDGRPAFHRG